MNIRWNMMQPSCVSSWGLSNVIDFLGISSIEQDFALHLQLWNCTTVASTIKLHMARWMCIKLKSDAWNASSNGSITEHEGTCNTIPPLLTALFAFHHESCISGSTRPFMNLNATTQWLWLMENLEYSHLMWIHEAFKSWYFKALGFGSCMLNGAFNCTVFLRIE